MQDVSFSAGCSRLISADGARSVVGRRLRSRAEYDHGTKGPRREEPRPRGLRLRSEAVNSLSAGDFSSRVESELVYQTRPLASANGTGAGLLTRSGPAARDCVDAGKSAQRLAEQSGVSVRVLQETGA